jgi:hypothetical protein
MQLDYFHVSISFNNNRFDQGLRLDSKGILEALNASHLFSELTEAQMDRVRRHSHVTDMVEGESLFFQGDNATSFYLVLSGRIKLFRISPDGKEKVVEIMEAGATFAEALMFMDQPHYPVKRDCDRTQQGHRHQLPGFQGDAARIDRHLFSAARGNELPFTRTDS